ncbi:MAG: hypothetical protein COB01_05585 [Lutibacter sp.]|nr:MAG: hypothetical protein COB01_05585 [Lutibacter sp.]
MRRFFLALFICTPLLIFSQKNNNPHYTISGKIIDASTQLPIEDATVIFKTINSEEIDFGGITNQKGKFSIDVKKGIYNVYVEFLSYQTKRLEISSVTRNINLGVISLEIDTEYLNEIEIIGEKRTLEFKRNKVIYNVDKDISTAGSTVTDILNNIPSISVDPDGQISVQGQGLVQVLINGKTSLLSKAEALKTLPAGSIEHIEVITNPGAKYKASALSVINIILKKGKDEGLNGSITATGGYKDYFGGLITLNNKTKNLNFFTNANYYNRNIVEISKSENEYFRNGITTSFLNENSDFDSKGKGFYTTIGVDFYFTKKATLTTSINYQNLENKNNTLTESYIFDESKILTNSNNRVHDENFNNESAEFILDFTLDFSKEGRQLATYISHLKDTDASSVAIKNNNTSIYLDENYFQKDKLKNTIAYLEFINPINEKSAYTIGYDGDFKNISFLYSELLSETTIEQSTNVNAAFFDYTYENKSFFFNVGLRAEFAELKLNYSDENINQITQFNDISPSISLSYSFSDITSITGSFKRLIIRPYYSRLQPFEQKYSETSSYIGNPNLEQIYLDKSSILLNFYGNKITFSSELFFSRYNDYWQDVTYETGVQLDGVNKIITTPVNLGKLDYYGVNLTSTLKVSKIVNFIGNISLFNYDQSGTFETVNSANQTIVLDYNYASFNGEFGLFTQLKIPTVFNFQTNVKHFLIAEGPYSTRKAYTYANVAISKDIFDKEATLTLTVDDLFNSRKTDRDRFDTNYFSKSLIKKKYRTILFSFTYRFNQSKKDRKIDFYKKNIKPKF